MRLRTICCLAILVSGCGERAADNRAAGAAPQPGSNAQSANAPANGPASGGDAQGAGPVAAPVTAVSLQPGNWQTSVTFSNIEVPGIPEQQAAAMRQQMGRPQTRANCITPAQAANPMGDIMGQPRRGCTFVKNTFAGGVIDVAANCTAPNQGQAQLAMTGSYTANTINAQIRMEARPPQGTQGGPQMVRMSGTVSSRRVGECAGAR